MVFGGALLVVCVAAWLAFDAETRARFNMFQRVTLVGFGLLGFAAFFALVRSRVVARGDRLVVVNGYRRHEYEWAEVRRGPPAAGRALGGPRPRRRRPARAAMGIQGSDGDRAKRAVRELRALIAQSSA